MLLIRCLTARGVPDIYFLLSQSTRKSQRDHYNYVINIHEIFHIYRVDMSLLSLDKGHKDQVNFSIPWQPSHVPVVH